MGEFSITINEIQDISVPLTSLSFEQELLRYMKTHKGLVTKGSVIVKTYK